MPGFLEDSEGHGMYQGGEVSEGKGLQGRVCRTLSLGKMGSLLSLRCNSRDKELRVRCLFGKIF